MEQYKSILYEEDGPVATITLNRPDVLNALSPELERELHSALDAAAEDDGVRAIILTGEGRAFSSGYDMLATDEMRDASDRTTRSQLRYWWRHDEEIQRGLLHIMELSKPVIAAVNGWCLGGGFWYALSSDITIASEEATFGQPEVRQISDTTILMALLVGWKHSHRYSLTGDHFDAAEALRIGVVNEVVPHVQLMDRAIAIARRLSLVPPDSVRLNKLITTYGLEVMGLRSALIVNGLLSSIVQSSRDAPEVAELYEAREAGDLRTFIRRRDEPFFPEPGGPRSRPKKAKD